MAEVAMIAHHVYGSVDLAYCCAMTLERRGRAEPNAANRYLDVVSGR